MLKTRLMVITDAPFMGTGFSGEMVNLAFRWAQSGIYDVYYVGLQYYGHELKLYDYQFPDIPHKGAFITLIGSLPPAELFGANVFKDHYKEYTPDLVMIMGDPRTLHPYIDLPPQGYALKQKLCFPLSIYVTLDGTPIHPSWGEMLKYVDMPIAMSEWALNEYFKSGVQMMGYIHHGENTDFWSTNNSIKQKKREELGISKSTVVYMNWEVNQHRKRLDALLRCWKSFHPENKDAVLVLNTDWDCRLGWKLEDLIKQYDIPRNTILSPMDVFGKPKYWEMSQPANVIRDQSLIGDVYLSTTSGEGFGKCLHPDSFIMTYDGVKQIKNVKIHDLVLGENGKWTEVLNVREKDYNGELIKINSFGNMVEYLTPEHKIKAFKKPKRNNKINMYKEQNAEWIESNKIEKGDIVTFPIFNEETYLDVEFDLMALDSSLNYKNGKLWYKMGYSNSSDLVKINRFVELDENLAKLLGLYVAEGARSEICIGKELGIIEEMKSIYLEKFGVEPKIYERKTTYRFCITQRLIQEFFLDLCGEHAENKKIPKYVLENKNKKILEQFIKYYLLGDGNKGNYKKGCTTTSLSLIVGLKLAFTKLNECPIFRKDESNNCFRLFTRSSEIIHSNKVWLNKNGFIGYLVKTIEKIYYNGKIIDLQTKSGSFSTISFTVHNCLLQALCLKMPVITVDYSAMPEVCKEGSLLIPSYEGRAGRFRWNDLSRTVEGAIVDEEKFTEAITRLYDQPSERIEMGEQGRLWAMNFDYDKFTIPAWLDMLGRVNTDQLFMNNVMNRKVVKVES